MARRVRFNGVEHSFPDDATDSEIAEALEAADKSAPVATPKPAPAPGFADNLATDALSYVGNLAKAPGELIEGGVQAVTHPINTVKSLAAGIPSVPGKLKSIYESLTQKYGTPSELLSMMTPPRSGAQMQLAEAGSDKIAKSAYEKPISTLSDVSALASLPGMVSGGARTLANLTNPLRAPANALNAIGATGKTDTLANYLYSSALKPRENYRGTILTPEKKAAALDRGLENRILAPGKLNRSGEKQIQDILTDSKAAHTDLIDKAAASPTTPPIHLDDLIAATYKEKKKMLSVGEKAKADAIDKWTKNVAAALPKELTITQAQKFKETLDEILKGKYGKNTPGKLGAQKAVRSESRQQILDAAKTALSPAEASMIDELNKKIGSSLDLKRIWKGREKQVENRQLLGLTGPLAGVINKPFGLTMGLAESPITKSRLAFALSSKSPLSLTDKNRLTTLLNAGAAVENNKE